ncbi:MAG: phytoene desaturase family protein [Bacteroidota bacterium]
MLGEKTAVVIGAGVGGIATALYLVRNGYRVDVFEKNSDPGGRCGQYIRDGHRFDLGATMYLMPSMYNQVFDSLGIKFEDREIVALNNLYRIFFDNGDELAFTPDKKRMKEQLEKIDPGSYEKAEKYVSEGYKIYLEGLDKLIGRNFFNLFQLVNFKNIGLLLRLKVFISNWKYAGKFFKNTNLRMAYTFQNIYVGQSPFDSPALFSMIPAAELTEGSFFPRGGMYAVIDKFYSAAVSEGAKFHFDSPAARINISNRKAVSITLEDGKEIAADIIVANADLPYVYRNLLPDKRKSDHIDRLKYSCSVICFHWAMDKEFPQLDHHNVFISDSLTGGLDRIFVDKTIDDSPTFYVHAPSRTDTGAAPPGQDTLTVAIGAGHLDPSKKQDWEMLRTKAREAVIRRLEKSGLQDFEKHIKFEICYTPDSWERYCHVSRGSVFGSLCHNIMQMGYFRPHNRHDRYSNLYFVGSSTHPGNGIPNVLLSAKLVSERILKEQN